MTDEFDTGEYCKIAFEEVFGLCQNPEDAFRQIAMFMGFTTHDINNVFPMDENYKEILSNDLGDAQCSDMQAARAWVLCRAWQLHKDESIEVIDSITAAWREFNETCFGS